MFLKKIKKFSYLNFLFIFMLIHTNEENKESLYILFNQASKAFFNSEFKKAIKLYKKALEINDQSEKVYLNLGSTYYSIKNFDKAIKNFNKALELKPDYHKAHQLLGIIYTQQGQHDLAIKHLKKATLIDFNDFSSHMNLGSNLILLQTFDQAEEYYKYIYPIFPEKYEILYNTAYTLKLQGKYQEAIPYYLKTIAGYPKFEKSYLGLAKSYLATGNFPDGWKYFEWRFLNSAEHQEKNFYQDLNASHLIGKTIFLRKEWGLGDMMHFARYIELLKNLNTTIYVQIQKPLETLFSLLPYIDKIIPHGEKSPPAHIQIPIMSLPLIFKTTLETIPTNIPYLYADQNLVAIWKEKLAHDTNFKVGICWHAKPIFLEENYLTKRSIPLQEFATLADIPNISFYSLQQIYGLEELKNIPQNFNIHTFGPDFDNPNVNGRFMDTAALIQNLDLVITADTSIVHLAGALGKPVWILLPYVAEWRWMQNTNKTPWYPKAQLFRQSEPNNWTQVMKEVTLQLSLLVQDIKKNKKSKSITLKK